jgi:hypothetical protein
VWHNKWVQYPLSHDEHAAIARYLSGIKKQLQEVSDLFRARYGKGSRIADEAIQTLTAVGHLESDFMMLEQEPVLAIVREMGVRAS